MPSQIKKKIRFCLVGHGYHAYHFAKLLLKKNIFTPIIITHKKNRHKRDTRELGRDKRLYKNIFELKKTCKIIETDEVNNDAIISLLKKNKITHIFSLSSRFIFKEKILDLYKNKIFNIHPSFLPEERGAANFSHRILQNKFYVCCSIHLIDKGIDTGAVILKSKKIKISKKSLPIKFLIETNKIYIKTLNQFLRNFEKDNIYPKKQDKKKGSYLSRVDSKISAIIDWSVDGKYIERFIKAMSYPYSGSSTFVMCSKKKIKIRIMNCNFKNIGDPHPYHYGTIFHQNNNIIKLFVKSGILKINLSDIKSETIIKNFIGKTFFNYNEEIINTKLLKYNA